MKAWIVRFGRLSQRETWTMVVRAANPAAAKIIALREADTHEMRSWPKLPVTSVTEMQEQAA